VIYGDKFGTLSFYDENFFALIDLNANNAVSWIEYTYAM